MKNKITYGFVLIRRDGKTEHGTDYGFDTDKNAKNLLEALPGHCVSEYLGKMDGDTI